MVNRAEKIMVLRLVLVVPRNDYEEGAHDAELGLLSLQYARSATEAE